MKRVKLFKFLFLMVGKHLRPQKVLYDLIQINQKYLLNFRGLQHRKQIDQYQRGEKKKKKYSLRVLQRNPSNPAADTGHRKFPNLKTLMKCLTP